MSRMFSTLLVIDSTRLTSPPSPSSPFTGNTEQIANVCLAEVSREDEWDYLVCNEAHIYIRDP